MWQEVTSRRSGARRHLKPATPEVPATLEVEGAAVISEWEPLRVDDDLLPTQESAAEPEALYSRTPSPADSTLREVPLSMPCSVWQSCSTPQGLGVGCDSGGEDRRLVKDPPFEMIVENTFVSVAPLESAASDTEAGHRRSSSAPADSTGRWAAEDGNPDDVTDGLPALEHATPTSSMLPCSSQDSTPVGPWPPAAVAGAPLIGQVGAAGPVTWLLPVAMMPSSTGQDSTAPPQRRDEEAQRWSCSKCDDLLAAQAALSQRVADLEIENAKLRTRVTIEPELLLCRLEELQQECHFLREQLAKALGPQESSAHDEKQRLPSRHSPTPRSVVVATRGSSEHSWQPAAGRSRRSAWERLLSQHRDEQQQQQRLRLELSQQPEPSADHDTEEAAATALVVQPDTDIVVTSDLCDADKQVTTDPPSTGKAARRARRRAAKAAERLALNAGNSDGLNRGDEAGSAGASGLAPDSVAPSQPESSQGGDASSCLGVEVPTLGDTKSATDADAAQARSVSPGVCLLGFWNPPKSAATQLVDTSGVANSAACQPMQLAWEEKRKLCTPKTVKDIARKVGGLGSAHLDTGDRDFVPAVRRNIGLTDRCNPLLQMPGVASSRGSSIGAASRASREALKTGMKEIPVGGQHQAKKAAAGAARAGRSDSRRGGRPAVNGASGPIGMPSSSGSSSIAESLTRRDATEKAARSNALINSGPRVFGTFTTSFAG